MTQMKFDPCTMKPTTIAEYKTVAAMGTEIDDMMPDDLFEIEDHLMVSDVLGAHAEVGRLNHDMVKHAMGPNWPADWDERTAIFDPPECFDCGTTGQCHMNCGPVVSHRPSQSAQAKEADHG
jgi:hypothetical protein